LVTALAEAELVHNAFEIGCDAYLSKPIEFCNLVEILRNLELISLKKE
jgi:two-component system, chemotaxis family, chemotaxis protein CheY